MGLFSRSKETYLVTGLGNYGAKYENTRHNAGFIAVDSMATKYGVKVNKVKHYSLMGEFEYDGKRILLQKPQTYMNNSGQAVADCARFYKIDPSHIIIISDDCNLDVGVLRIRTKGSAGGHNGLKSIIAHLGTQDFLRMRIGVGKKPSETEDLADFVLGSFTQADIQALEKTADRVASAIELVVSGDTVLAMSRYNG